MEFQQDWPKDKKITAMLIFCLKTQKNFAQLELYHAPLEGSTNFLYRSFTSHTPLDSSQLGELNMHFSAV